MDRKLLLAVALSFGVYAAWFTFMERKTPRHAAIPAASTAAVQASGPAPQPVPSPAAPPSAPAVEKALSAREAEIRASSRGAAVSSYRYRGPMGLVELVESPEAGLLATWPELDFSPEPGDDARTLSYSARLPSGLLARKELRFSDSPEGLHSLRVTLRNPSGRAIQAPAWELALGPGLGTVASEKRENAKLQRAIALLPPPEGRSRDALQKLKPGEYRGPWRWLAVDNRYFLLAVIASPEDFELFRVEERVSAQGPLPVLRLAAKPRAVAPGGSLTVEVPFYLGPKAYTILEKTGLGLERSVDFGWFDSLGRLALKLLQRLHRLTGNYGWSIILLTVMLQLVLCPLTFKSLKAAAVMKRLQPEIARVQQKYKDDPKRLNAELMALYKSKGANPLGGCLPMLAQMPVFVALFNALRNAWELHGAPWMLWVRDLSSQDPLFILPVLMGGVMFLQNRLNPAVSSDPAQAKIMNWMPVVFTFMFLKFPSGLVLYWLTNSLLSFSQQMLLRRRFA